MLEGHDGPAVEAEAGVPFDNHRLLLSLAGLIDDELLGWSRELAAVGEFDHALELVTAAIAADGVRLPEAVHAALLAARRGQPGVEVPEPEKCPVPAHRFLPDPTAAGYPAVVGGGSPVEALGGLPDRLLRDCRLWLSWRLTPAGAAPAPVPHPVLLVEAGDGVGADLLAYQVADLLWQAGVFASVEVFGPDTPVGEYHRAALDASVALDELGGKGASATSASASPDDAPPAASALLGAPVFPDTPARETSSTPARETSSRPPLRPVERVIAARASAPRNPIDNVMPFERTPQDRPLPERQPLQERQPLPERQPLQERPVQGPDRGGYDPFDSPGERPSGEPVRGSRRDQRPSAPRDQRNRPRDEAFGPPPGLVRPPAPNFGHTDWQSSGPPTAPPGPPLAQPGRPPVQPGSLSGPPPMQPGPMTGPQQAQPGPMTGPQQAQPGPMTGPQQAQPGPPMTERRPMDRRPPERNGMGRDRNVMGPDRNGMGPNGMGGGIAATRAVPPVKPLSPLAGQPPLSVGQSTTRQQPVKPPPPAPPQPAPPQPAAGPQPAGALPKRPGELPELPDGLSDVEQKLLRQLHEELAVREDNGLPAADQAPQRAFRNGRPPRRPTAPPSDPTN